MTLKQKNQTIKELTSSGCCCGSKEPEKVKLETKEGTKSACCAKTKSDDKPRP